MEFNDPVVHFRAAVAGPVGSEIGQELSTPRREGAAEPGDLRDRAGGERRDDRLCDRATVCDVSGSGCGAESLVAAPGDGDFEMRGAGLQPGFDSFDLAGGEVVGAGPQGVADLWSGSFL